MRTLIAYHLALANGALAHTKQENFRNAGYHAGFMSAYHAEVSRQRVKSVFVRHNLEKYGELPLWAAVEIMSLGMLSKLYGNIASTQVRKHIAQTFDLTEWRLKNWLEVLSYIRNACAHHQRLYSRPLPTSVSLPPRLSENQGDSLFAVLLILKQLFSNQLKRWDTFLQALNSELRLTTYVDTSTMGFPGDWYDELQAF